MLNFSVDSKILNKFQNIMTKGGEAPSSCERLSSEAGEREGNVEAGKRFLQSRKVFTVGSLEKRREEREIWVRLRWVFWRREEKQCGDSVVRFNIEYTDEAIHGSGGGEFSRRMSSDGDD
ncbi:hypothetical protein L2E82_13733 [Cichorium intybus]|uniref:Uncharacterized protein n=1 Tax=Cichorium intybus TaxID=13427 RepID=A0ACB9EYN2_CICIN|nr:hypothetical protein L2E82_13733 [Cichorium intybus]